MVPKLEQESGEFLQILARVNYFSHGKINNFLFIFFIFFNYFTSHTPIKVLKYIKFNNII